MRIIVVSLLLIVNFVFSTTLFQALTVIDIMPDFTVLVVVSYAILRGDIEGSIVGFFAGLLIDVFFGVLGMSAMLYFLIGFVAGKPFRDFFRENYFLPLLLAAAASLIYESATYFFTYLFMGQTDFLYYFNRKILPAALYSMIFAIPVYRLIYFINNKIEILETPKRKKFY